MMSFNVESQFPNVTLFLSLVFYKRCCWGWLFYQQLQSFKCIKYHTDIISVYHTNQQFPPFLQGGVTIVIPYICAMEYKG